MEDSKKNSGKRWTEEDVSKLKVLVGGNTPTRLIAVKLGRTLNAVYDKAGKEDITLKPNKQSPYNRRKQA